MFNKPLISIPIVLLGVILSIVAPQAGQDAPTGFNAPMLAAKPGSQSVSNGIAEPAGGTFARDQAVFETIHDASRGRDKWRNAHGESGSWQQNDPSFGRLPATRYRYWRRNRTNRPAGHCEPAAYSANMGIADEVPVYARFGIADAPGRDRQA